MQGLCTHSSLMHISLPGNQRAGLPRSSAHDSHHSWHECGQREGPYPAPKCEPCTSLTPLPEGPASYMTHSRGAGGGGLSLPNTQPLEHSTLQCKCILATCVIAFTETSTIGSGFVLFLSLHQIIHLYIHSMDTSRAKYYYSGHQWTKGRSALMAF